MSTESVQRVRVTFRCNECNRESYASKEGTECGAVIRLEQYVDLVTGKLQSERTVECKGRIIACGGNPSGANNPTEIINTTNQVLKKEKLLAFFIREFTHIARKHPATDTIQEFVEVVFDLHVEGRSKILITEQKRTIEEALESIRNKLYDMIEYL